MQTFLIPRAPWHTPTQVDGYWRGPFIINRYGLGWALSNLSGLSLAVHTEQATIERMADALRGLDIDWYGQYQPGHFSAVDRQAVGDVLRRFEK
jgi:hypothetical protein